MAKSSHKFRVGTNVGLSVVLALGCWALAGWINQRHFQRWDVTENRTHSLSDKTLMVLRGLEEPITVTTLFRPGSVLERNAQDLLEEYARKSERISLIPIDPDKDAAKVELLAKRLNLNSFQLNSVLFESNGKTKQVQPTDMEEREPSANPFMPSQKPPKFKGEEAFTSAILNLTESKIPQVYFSVGHGEKDFNAGDGAGLSELVKFLKRENYHIQQWAALQEGDVPEDADVVIIASPQEKFLSQEIEKLDSYLKQGGKLLVFLDPLADTGLEPMLESWGIEVGDDVVVDPVRRLFFAGPTTLIVNDFGAHPITEKMKGSVLILSLARSVSPMAIAEGNVQILLKTSPEAWAEIDYRVQQSKYDEGKDRKGPVSVAVALTKSADNSQETRLVVLGDCDFLTNVQMSNGGNLGFFTNAVNWLASREKLISIPPKLTDVRQATATAGQMKMMLWFTMLGMPLAGIVGGSAVWFRRRR